MQNSLEIDNILSLLNYSYLNLIARCILMVKGETRRPEGMMQNVSFS